MSNFDNLENTIRHLAPRRFSGSNADQLESNVAIEQPMLAVVGGPVFDESRGLIGRSMTVFETPIVVPNQELVPGCSDKGTTTLVLGKAQNGQVLFSQRTAFERLIGCLPIGGSIEAELLEKWSKVAGGNGCPEGFRFKIGGLLPALMPADSIACFDCACQIQEMQLGDRFPVRVKTVHIKRLQVIVSHHP